MEPNQQLDTSIVQYDNLPNPPNLDENLLAQIDSHIKGLHWSASYQCITVIRSICKYHPQFIVNIMEKYGVVILQLANHSTTQLLKNILKLLKQIFMCGNDQPLEPVVSLFLPFLIKKASETGHIKEIAQDILIGLTTNCCYAKTIELITELSLDKTLAIAELAIKMLAAILQNIGPSLTQINPMTLQILMKGLSLLINGKRNNMKTSALDVCIFVCNQMGSENFLQLMNYSLNQSETLIMGQQMETHRTQKNKQPHLADLLKQRKSQMGYGQNNCMNWNNQNIR